MPLLRGERRVSGYGCVATGVAFVARRVGGVRRTPAVISSAMSRSVRRSRRLHGRLAVGLGVRAGLVSATVWQVAGQRLVRSASKR